MMKTRSKCLVNKNVFFLLKTKAENFHRILETSKRNLHKNFMPQRFSTQINQKTQIHETFRFLDAARAKWTFNFMRHASVNIHWSSPSCCRRAPNPSIYFVLHSFVVMRGEKTNVFSFLFHFIWMVVDKTKRKLQKWIVLCFVSS